MRRDQETPQPDPDENETCQVQHGDGFKAHVANGALLLQHLPNNGNGTDDEEGLGMRTPEPAEGDWPATKRSGAYGGAGDQRSARLRQMGRDRLYGDLNQNGKLDNNIAGLGEYQRMLDAHYRQNR
jgi:hypothetical protein